MPDFNRYETALDIINSASIECGLGPVVNFSSSTQGHIKQLATLLTNCGRWLAAKAVWPELIRDFSLTTQSGDTGKYDLPADFGYMLDQTGWETTGSYPIAGPLSSQDWKMLQAGNIDPIYVGFRFRERQLWLYSQPPPVGLTIQFEYISRGWVLDADGTTYRDNVTAEDDKVLYEPLIVTQFLRKRFLAARGFSTQSADQDFQEVMDMWRGKGTGAPVLYMTGRRNYPLIDIRNAPETGIGL